MERTAERTVVFWRFVMSTGVMIVGAHPLTLVDSIKDISQRFLSAGGALADIEWLGRGRPLASGSGGRIGAVTLESLASVFGEDFGALNLVFGGVEDLVGVGASGKGDESGATLLLDGRGRGESNESKESGESEHLQS